MRRKNEKFFLPSGPAISGERRSDREKSPALPLYCSRRPHAVSDPGLSLSLCFWVLCAKFLTARWNSTMCKAEMVKRVQNLKVRGRQEANFKSWPSW